MQDLQICDSRRQRLSEVRGVVKSWLAKKQKYSGGDVTDLKAFADLKGIKMPKQKTIVEEAAVNIAKRYPDESVFKAEFDGLIFETQEEIFKVYRKYEDQYESRLIKAFVDHLVGSGEIKSVFQAGDSLSKYSRVLDSFFLSMANSRKSRAGGAFENIHTSLFKQLHYKFDTQKVIDGKPDFIMPSEAYFHTNAPECIIFTAKRTLRERWRQVVTEGAQGARFFLATIDGSLSGDALKEMLDNRITLVVPEKVRSQNYKGKNNVLSFKQFFEDHLDPAVERWKRHGVYH